MADHELNPLTRAVMGQPHSLCQILMTVAETILTFADIALLPWPKLQSVVLLLCLVPMTYWHLDMVRPGGETGRVDERVRGNR